MCGVAIEDDDVDTVGGLMAKHLGRVPIAGSVVEAHGLRFEAEGPAGRRNRIGSVVIAPLEPTEPDADPGGLAQDLPPGAVDQIREFVKKMRKNLPEYDKLATGNPIFKARMQDVGYLDLAGCMALGATGPILRSAGLPHDLRKSQPYCGYENYDFEVPDRRHLRLLRPLPHPAGGDAPVAAGSSSSAWTGCSPARSWSPTRRSPGPRSSRSARTGSATPSTTSRRSWAPPWRP